MRERSSIPLAMMPAFVVVLVLASKDALGCWLRWGVCAFSPSPVVFVEVGCLLLMGSWSADQVHHPRVEYTSGRAASSPIIISSGRCGEISSREQPDLANSKMGFTS